MPILLTKLSLSINPNRKSQTRSDNAAELKNLDFDLAVLFPNSFETALVAKMAKIPRQLRLRQGRQKFSAHRFRRNSRVEKRRATKFFIT